ALERLESEGEAEKLRWLHAEHFVQLTERAEPELVRSEQHVWLDRLEAEVDNIREALTWIFDSDDAELGATLVSSLDRFWINRGHLVEARRWYDRALASDSELVPSLEKKLLKAAGGNAYALSDHERARELGERRLELAREQGDTEDEAACLSNLGI